MEELRDKEAEKNQMIAYGEKFLHELIEKEPRLDVAFGASFYLFMNLLQLIPPNHRAEAKEYIQRNLDKIYEVWEVPEQES